MSSSSAAQSIRELTPRVIVLGIVLSVVMGAANVYLGLKAGMTVSASIPAAVVAMLILRGFFRDGTILEANQVQTAASAGESLAAGIIFTVPAIVLLGLWNEFDIWVTAAIGFTGGLLGILFMIPMRRVFVTSDDEELKFPEGLACAAVLESGTADEGETKSQAMSVVHGALLGASANLLIKFVGIIQSALQTAGGVGGRIFYFGGDISPALVAVGFIVRLHIAVLIFIGGAIAWLAAIPLLGATPEQLASPVDGAFDIWNSQIRYLGVGAMIVGGADAIFKVRHGLVRAVHVIWSHRGDVEDAVTDETDRDISGRAIIFWSVVATGAVAGIYWHFTHDIGETAITTISMIILSFFFTAVASYIVGLVGNSNSPVSGMTITAVLVTAGLLIVLGYSGEAGMLATLGVAAVVCCAACTSGDVCNDLKTGQLVGASPRRQQMMQILGVAVASFVLAPVMGLLHRTSEGGIGGREFPAPQAKLFEALVGGFFGDATIPWNMVTYGVVIGLVILVIDWLLRRGGVGFRAHLMPIAVGIYLPFELATPILAGGLIAWALARGTPEAEVEEKLRPGVLYASGAIAGESLMGIFLAILAGAGIMGLGYEFSSAVTVPLSLVAVVVILAAFYRYGAER